MSARGVARRRVNDQEKRNEKTLKTSSLSLQSHFAKLAQQVPQAVSKGPPPPDGPPSEFSSGISSGLPTSSSATTAVAAGPRQQMTMALGTGVPQGLLPEYGGAPTSPAGARFPTTNARYLMISTPSPTSTSASVAMSPTTTMATTTTAATTISDHRTVSSSHGSADDYGASLHPTTSNGSISSGRSGMTSMSELASILSDTASTYPQHHLTHPPPVQRIETFQTKHESGVAKSSLRNIVDKRGDGMRHGLARLTFLSLKKGKDAKSDSDLSSLHGRRPPSSTHGQLSPGRPPSQAASDPMQQTHRFHSHSQLITTASVPGTSHSDVSSIHSLSSPMPPPRNEHHMQYQLYVKQKLDKQQQQAQQQQQQKQQQQQQHGRDGSIKSGHLHHQPSLNQPSCQHHHGLHQHSTPAQPSATTETATVSVTIKRWTGTGRGATQWNELHKDPELWDPNGDVLVYLGSRDQLPRPTASFRLSSHIIEATGSEKLIELLRQGLIDDDTKRTTNLAPGAANIGPFSMMATRIHGRPTPAMSEDSSDGPVSYEIFLPAPPSADRMEQLRHDLATRNTFALLHHASLVGTSLREALEDLLERLDEYMDPNADILADVINYLRARGIDDIRGDPDSAVALLAWAELPEVQWEDGWRECFVHCVGMFPTLERCDDFAATTPITRALLERAFLETSIRVHGAEERLSGFNFDDLWPSDAAGGAVQSQAAATRLGQFFVSHYSRVYGQWPPAKSHSGDSEDHGEGMWLNRTITQAMQKDFAALYDYYVNRDIVWDESGEDSKPVLVSKSGARSFKADLEDFSMTDMLVEFDDNNDYPHIPHPFPLLPESVPLPRGGAISSASHRERRVQLSYTEATNVYILGSDLTHSDLVDAFARFEKTDLVGESDPAVARRGRWVVIYCVLQTLATVSVDAPLMRHSDGVSYHLCPRFKNATISPWKADQISDDEADGERSPREDGPVPLVWRDAVHEDSHCWLVPGTWKRSSKAGRNNARLSMRRPPAKAIGVAPMDVPQQPSHQDQPRQASQQQQQLEEEEQQKRQRQ